MNIDVLVKTPTSVIHHDDFNSRCDVLVSIFVTVSQPPLYLTFFSFFSFLSFFNIFKRKREKKGRTIPLFRSVRCHQNNRSFVAVQSILRFFHRSLSNDASHYAFRCSWRNCERPLAWFRSRRVFHCNLEILPRRATVERAARVT